MKTCAFYPKINLTTETDSDAHIIPSALGGILKPRGILSRAANAQLNELVDSPFIHAWRPFMQMIGGARDRGEPGTLRMQAADGRIYVDRGEGFLAPEKPTYRTQPLADGRDLLIVEAGNQKQLRQIVKKAQKDHPNLDIDSDAAVRQATLGHKPIRETLTVSLTLAAIVDFPAAFVAASLFAATHGFAPHPDFAAYVKSLDPKQGGPRSLPPDTMQWQHNPPPRRVATAAVSHIVILHASAARRRMIVYLEYFNVVCLAVTLPYQGQADVWKTHGVDVLTGREVAVEPARDVFVTRPWVASHQPDTPPSDLEERISHVILVSRSHKLRSCLAAVFKRHCRGRKRAEMSQEEVAKMVTEVKDVRAAIVIGLAGGRDD